jgi:tellurite resistance protein TehA-like permease
MNTNSDLHQGVYTNAAVQLGKILDSPAFKVWSTVLAVLLVIIWLACIVFTIRGLIRRQLVLFRIVPKHALSRIGSSS